MPLDKRQFERLHLIHEALLHGSYSLNELLDYLQEKFNNGVLTGKRYHISRRTLINDIHFLREKGAPIPFRKKKYTYTAPFSFLEALGNTDSLMLEEFKGIVHKLQTVNKISAVLDLNSINIRLKDTEKGYVYFEENQELTNFQFLPELYEFIYKQKVIVFDYKDFFNQKFTITLHPYLLKEYSGRWYLYGREHVSSEVRPYAIDRMAALPDLRKGIGFRGRGDWDPQAYFSAMVGVTKPKGAEPECVIVRVYGQSQLYLMTKPLHSSQSVAEEEDDYTDFSFEVILNYEFKSKIFSLGVNAEIISPLHLREEFSEVIKKMGERYGFLD